MLWTVLDFQKTTFYFVNIRTLITLSPTAVPICGCCVPSATEDGAEVQPVNPVKATTTDGGKSSAKVGVQQEYELVDQHSQPQTK